MTTLRIYGNGIWAQTELSKRTVRMLIWHLFKSLFKRYGYIEIEVKNE